MPIHCPRAEWGRAIGTEALTQIAGQRGQCPGVNHTSA